MRKIILVIIGLILGIIAFFLIREFIPLNNQKRSDLVSYSLEERFNRFLIDSSLYLSDDFKIKRERTVSGNLIEYSKDQENLILRVALVDGESEYVTFTKDSSKVYYLRENIDDFNYSVVEEYEFIDALEKGKEITINLIYFRDTLESIYAFI